jgi:hypothetical protein
VKRPRDFHLLAWAQAACTVGLMPAAARLVDKMSPWLAGWPADVQAMALLAVATAGLLWAGVI